MRGCTIASTDATTVISRFFWLPLSLCWSLIIQHKGDTASVTRESEGDWRGEIRSWMGPRCARSKMKQTQTRPRAALNPTAAADPKPSSETLVLPVCAQQNPATLYGPLGAH